MVDTNLIVLTFEPALRACVIPGLVGEETSAVLSVGVLVFVGFFLVRRSFVYVDQVMHWKPFRRQIQSSYSRTHLPSMCGVVEFAVRLAVALYESRSVGLFAAATTLLVLNRMRTTRPKFLFDKETMFVDCREDNWWDDSIQERKKVEAGTVVRNMSNTFTIERAERGHSGKKD